LQLWQLTVAEWMENSALYEEFLSEEEATKFLVPGYFHGHLADTMLTSLFNALQTPIIVFSSIACHPFFCVTPNAQTIPVPLMVAFNQSGVGHYGGVLVTCRNTETHCRIIKHTYTTTVRCACLKSGTCCRMNCHCKNCDNPCGPRPEVLVQSRKGFKHEWQEHKHMSSRKFANTKQEELASGLLTKVEFFVLGNILAFCCEEDIDATPDNMSKVYDRVLAFIQQTDPT